MATVATGLPLSFKASEEELRTALESLLASQEFRTSKRNSRFLRFVVEQTLLGHSDSIKERLIGIEVFDRDADYDLNADPIVRVAAGDIRKRLAQYYAHDGIGARIRFSLPSGRYVPTFAIEAQPARLRSSSAIEEHPADAAPARPVTDQPPSVARFYRVSKLAAWGSCIVLLIASSLISYYYLSIKNRPTRELTRLWQPVLQADRQVILCVGDLNFITLREPSRPLDNSEALNGVMTGRNHIGPNDANALARVASMFGQHDTTFRVIPADDATLTDLRSAPAVLIGAIDNQWTQRLQKDLRFSISETPDHVGIIEDHTKPTGTKWMINMGMPIGQIHRDYALVTRVSHPMTDQPVIVVAGIGPFGTAAASEFISNPTYFREFVSKAPAGWEHRDLQIVLSTDVVNGRSGPPHIEEFDVR